MPNPSQQPGASEHSLWWQLHLRHARGESLSADEKAIYFTERDRLEAEETETLRPGLERLRELREEVTRREAELIRLRTENDTLKATLQRHEARLDKRTKLALGI